MVNNLFENSYYLLFILAFGLSYSLTPWARKLSQKMGMVDVPNHRKVHKIPVPYGGGIAIFLGFLLALFFLFPLSKHIIAFVLAASILVACGIYDDSKGLSAIPKFIIQSLAALIVIWAGISIDMGVLLRGRLSDFQFLAIPLTYFWLVGITNAINLIDGLDGLAAGVSTISAFTLAVVSWMNGSNEVATLALILGAASLGFLPHNFRSRVFMGDAGSMFLGFSLAVFSVLGSVKLAAAFSLFVPVMILAIPIFDTLFAIFRRLASHQSIFEGDKKHLHHRLLEMGFSPLQTVIFIYLLSFLFGAIAIFSAMIRPRDAYIVFLISFVAIFLIIISLVLIHQKRSGNKS